MKKTILGLMACVLLAVPAMAETLDGSMNPIISAMPSLTIAPDARAAGMGDLGVATRADLNSQHWNPAKYAFMESHGGFTANYTPWLRQLVSDIDLAYLAGYYKWDDLDAIGMSFTYFSLGDVSLTDLDGNFIQNARPNEWALDLSYSRKLHEYVSMAVALRFMMSDLSNGANAVASSSAELRPGWTMAADIALYYKQPIELPMGTSYISAGLNISNLGGKISYYDDDQSQQFIPARGSLGVAYEIPFDNYNRLSAAFDLNKYLVPTRQSKFTTQETAKNPTAFAKGEDYTMSQKAYSDINPARGWFMSFADAPGGFKEEMQELQYGVGLEYSYDRKFFARVGYSHENRWKGNRRYATLGAGFHLSIFNLDVSYCIGAAGNPLNNTMRFTLGFDLAGIKDLVNNRK